MQSDDVHEFSRDRAGAPLALEFKNVVGSLYRDADSQRSYPGCASAQILVRLINLGGIAF